MIVMPGAWRCERHRLWTNGDCPDCDLDLIAAHEERQDEDMSAPLTTRDALAGELTRHRLIDRQCACGSGVEFGTTGEHADHLADALLASGALIDATKLAALADKWNSTPDYDPTDYDRGRVDQRHAMTAELLLAALSPQSERAEVER